MRNRTKNQAFRRRPEENFARKSNSRLFETTAYQRIMPIDRRQFVSQSLQAAAASLPFAAIANAAQGERPRILLRSSWQTVNIGDIAHTPGVLALLEKYLPDAEVRLWPTSLADGVESMMLARFPKLQLVQSTEEQAKAFRECDFLLHGSGPYLVAKTHVQKWKAETGKPYGVYGITIGLTGSADIKPTSDHTFAETIDILSQAKFSFFRDSKSLELAKAWGCKCPIMEFGPDGAFGTDLRDDAKADTFLSQHDLQPGKFLCCIPRLRYTPYWLIKEKTPFDETKHTRNEAMKEHDHAPHRKAIERVVRETDFKVLICPEDKTQMAVGKELLYDKLPDDVKKRVVHRPDYWLTDEALSTYRKSAGLFGNEMHSPIMCIGNGIPAIVCRWKEQTTKGLMWRDIGLGDWLFDFDQEDEISRLPETVLQLARDPEASKAKAVQAQAYVQKRQQETMAILGQNKA
jgi:polysaccharide pyruvyl transferase WcaK-like protein